MNKVVFLDRDGVINKTIFRMGKERAPYMLEEFQLYEGVSEAVIKLKAHGFMIIVVTNQPDVARGWVSREQVDLVNEQVRSLLPVDEIKCCFHTEKDHCQCRKPLPGMLLESAKKWDLDLSLSFMVGDRISDIQAGQSAGCKSILITQSENYSTEATPEHQCESLLEACDWILT